MQYEMESPKSGTVLPASFAELEPFAHWALATERERLMARESSTMEELQMFYDAMMPRLVAIVEYLNDFPSTVCPKTHAGSSIWRSRWSKSASRRNCTGSPRQLADSIAPASKSA